MSWAEAIAAVFKVIGSILDMKAKGELTQDKLDAAIKALERPLPPKE